MCDLASQVAASEYVPSSRMEPDQRLFFQISSTTEGVDLSRSALLCLSAFLARHRRSRRVKKEGLYPSEDEDEDDDEDDCCNLLIILSSGPGSLGSVLALRQRPAPLVRSAPLRSREM